MIKYKLLALDMDGTLLDERKEISQQNKEWIAKCREQGVYVVLSTGRGIQLIRSYAEQLELDTPIVAVNGGEVWSGPDKLHVRYTLPMVQIEQLRRLAIELDVWYWAYHTEGKMNRDTWDELDNRQMEWIKFGFSTEDSVKMTALFERIPQIGDFELTNSHPTNIEVNPAGITKATGLHEVCHMLNVGIHEVVAVGDSMNDMAMIVEVGLGVAMGNAQEEVKLRADAVTDSNEEDGVAKVIQRYICFE
ncbi:phosphoglycolate phosphatase, TA0175-type [Paenibacillus sp. Soil766]|uniref:HAD family hydrolase n=1 Tax=Paenibacillus sp. Soil766 TaxID=1736404 RepID=UPI0007088E60|nr:Cof-type HAD-IIB family hydrolase [Paenibacillus sp. Soil766]KRF03378.1 phosphoglycolate phosphatase, TA0175-type [Paenibacillus sp. Soil766]